MKMFEIFLGSIILLFVLYQLVDFIVCDSTGDEPERWECWAQKRDGGRRNEK